MRPAFRMVVIVLTFLLVPLHAVEATPLSRTEASAWQHDLDYLASSLERYHADAFHDTSRDVFERRVASLRARLPQLDRAGAILGLASITALVHDAHTGFGLGGAAPISFHSLPIKVYEYADGVFVQAADPAHRDVVGEKIVSVGGVPIAEVLHRLQTIASATNEWTFRSQLQFFFKTEIFHAFGLSNSDRAATLEFGTGNHTSRVTLNSLPGAFPLGYKPGPPAGSDWVDARAPGEPPLYLSHLDKFYWSTLLPNERTMYVQCNFVLNAGEESFGDFFTKAFAAADAARVDKFVLDLRFNGGGDNLLLPAVVQDLVKHTNLNLQGKLFVIIGRGTQSAAENFVNRLQRDTKAVFVGEPTGERPNEYGDPWPFILPNSHIKADIASIQWEDIDPRDDRNWTGPDLGAELTSSDYAANVDPAMQRILTTTYVPIEAALAQALESRDVTALSKAYESYVSDPLHTYTQTQFAIEDIGQRLLDEKQFDLAQAILALNAGRNPNSARAIDALCDAFLRGGAANKAAGCYASLLRRYPRDAIAASRLSSLNAGQMPDM